MLAMISLLLAMAPPLNTTEIGPFRFTQSSALMWPGTYLPDFHLVPERRWVHRFSFGFAHRAAQSLTVDVVGVEASRDPSLRQRTLGVPSLEGAHNLWLGTRWAPAGRNVSMMVGRPFSTWAGPAPGLGRSVTKFSVHGRF